jgi:hypothetical protein
MVGGGRNRGRGADRLRLGKEILGLSEVLKRMKEDNAADIMLASRSQVSALTVAGKGINELNDSFVQ